MKASIAAAAISLAMFLILLPFSARGEDKGRVGGEPAPMRAGSGMGATTNHVSVGTRSVASAGVPAPTGNYSPGIAVPVAVPNIRGTSFGTIGAYYDWNNYYSYLCLHYNMNPLYFSRFYRNTEPLITPDMLKLTLRTPIQLSAEMLDSIDQLESMLKDAELATTVDSQAIREKSKRIRELAKEIRKNETLSKIDLRKKMDLYKKDEHNSLSPESMAMLREMALDLNRQLRNMYNQPSTAVISVDSYSEPSLESLAKSIEKLCKGIEKSAKQM